MQAMVILKRCRDAEKEIARIRMRIRQRRDLATSIGAPALDPNRVGRGSGDPDKNGRLAAEAVDLQNELQRRMERKAAEEACACTLLDLVPDAESDVLYHYYVMRESTGEAARALHYQDGYVRKVKRRGEEIMRLLSPEKVAEALPAWYLREYGDDMTRRVER